MFAYCGNNPVNNMDPSGNIYVRTPNISKKWGVPAQITQPSQPPYADQPQAIEESPSSVGNSSDGFLTEEQMNENATIIYNCLIERGWSSNAICAVLGNMQTESYTINPGKRQDYGGPGYGLVQWDPASKYLDWAAGNGYAANSLIGQVEYLSCTMKPGGGEWLPNNNSVPAGYGMMYSNFITSNENVGYLSLVFLYCYERAGVSQ